MRALIAIPSCARDRDNVSMSGQRSLLNAMAAGGGADYRFFLGAGNADPVWDEVILPVRDDYEALPQKVRQMFRWALDFGYDYLFKCDRDTFIHADRLLASLLEHAEQGHDYFGLVGNPGDCCGGGAGYWVSRKAMIAYLQNYDEAQLSLANYQKLEDWCLFTILDRCAQISPICDRRYWDLRLGPVPDPETNITWNPWKP